VSTLVFDAISRTAPGGVVCLTGVSPTGRRISVDVGSASREMVLENDVVVGSVNVNLRHYAAAADDRGPAAAFSELSLSPVVVEPIPRLCDGPMTNSPRCGGGGVRL
jgi:hypothetical protein